MSLSERIESRIEPDLKAWVETHAEKIDRKPGAVVRIALREYRAKVTQDGATTRGDEKLGFVYVTDYDDAPDEVQPFYCDTVDRILCAEVDWRFCPACGKPLPQELLDKLQVRVTRRKETTK